MAYQDLVLSDAPVAYWPLQEGAGADAADASGHGFGAVYPGDGSAAPGVAGPFAGQLAASFPGDYGITDDTFPGYAPGLRISSPSGLPHMGTALSVEAWCWAPAPSASLNDWWQNILYWGAAGVQTGDAPFAFARLAVRPAHAANIGDPVFTESGGGDLEANLQPQTGSWAYGSWHHVVFTLDNGAPDRCAVYWDGQLWSALADVGFSPLTAWDTAPAVAAIGGVGTPTFNYSWQGRLAHVALYDYALRPCAVLAHYDLATTGSYTPCPEWLRVAHAGGQGFWQSRGDVVEEYAAGLKAREHDGTTGVIYSGGVAALRTPLPTLTGTPEILVGKDPVTGLPVFCPAPSLPAPVTPTTSPPIETPTAIPPPAPPPTDAHKRHCAQAIAMESYLVVNYDLVAQILSSTFAGFVGELTYDVLFKLANVLSKVFQPPWGSFYQAPVLVTLLNTIWQYIVGDATAGTLGGPNLFKLIIHLFPVLADAQMDLIKCACYCALQSTGGEVNATFVTTWRNYMAESNPAFPLPGLQAFVCGLEEYVPLVYWQALAAIGGLGSSDTCDGCDCGLF